jgi:transcription termination factor Rho
MSVLQRSDLEASPLADLHAIASTLNIDGFRRLRRDDLIDAILARQEGQDVPTADAEQAAELDEEEPAASEADAAAESASTRRRSRWRRGRGGEDGDEGSGDAEHERGAEIESDTALEAIESEPGAVAADAPEDKAADEDRAGGRGRGGRGAARGGRGADRGDREDRGADRADSADSGARRLTTAREPERNVEGVIELLPNGSGFVRLVSGETSDDDVYVSAAQVRRCELVAGDRVSGPVRPARRSERFPSLIRIEEINGEPADEVAAGTPYDELPAGFPTELLPLGDGDETLAAIARIAPIGRGSRVVIAGASRSGKTELLRRIAASLADREGVSLEVALVGVRPEELGEWQGSPLSATPPLSFAASAETQAQAVEQAVERGRRIAARGGDAVLLIDTLDGLHPPGARRALAGARNLSERGSLTIIATAARPFGGETTVVALDLARASTGRMPALDPLATGSVRPDLLVGPEGAAAIVTARAEALED